MQEGIDFVECKICLKTYKRISTLHLRTHGLIEKTYKDLYPNAIMMTENTKLGLTTNSLEHFIKNYGSELGPIKYDEYKKFQSRKNTLEYKKEKYGWTDKEFKSYNATRAVTLNNLTQRHGIEKGTKIFNDYKKKQAYSGCVLEYFQEKYGMILGKEKYENVNQQKRNILKNYVRIYGNEKLAKRKLKEFHQGTGNSKSISNIQREFIEDLLLILPNGLTILSLNDEFVAYDDSREKFYKYDFIINNPIKLCIEFNGDWWHCNPSFYSGDYYNKTAEKTAEEIWKYDHLKIRHIENLGYKTIIVWENDYKNDKDKKLLEIKEWILNELESLR